MRPLACLACVSIALALPSALPAGNEVNGTWQLTTLVPMGTDENASWLFSCETAAGKTTATVISKLPAAKGAKQEEVSVTVEGGLFRLVINGASKQVFEGRMAKNGQKIEGIFDSGKTVAAAYLTPSKLEALDAKTAKQKVNVSVADLNAWCENAVQLAKAHGAKATIDVNLQMAAAFLAKKSPEHAARCSMAAVAALTNATPADVELKALQTAARALAEANKEADLKPLAERLEKLEKALDEQYHATVPPFKAKAFAGRKGQSDRVVVMELFTGAQCPPCVAADVAFDVLQKTYKPSELALIQYHLHIPGADPMTNADTVNRAKYYTVSGTPSSFFNGQKKATGGGTMAKAEMKFEAYREVIDPLFEETSSCKVTASAKRVNNVVQIQTEVTGVEKPGQDIKLRLVLLEENVRFVGVNKLRIHHQVVRAMPGGVAGVAVVNPSLTTKNEVNLSDLRKTLIGYLDEYNLTGTKAPFPQIGRPLDLTGLRVIAFLQDDKTQEILQAVQVDVQ